MCVVGRGWVSVCGVGRCIVDAARESQGRAQSEEMAKHIKA